MALSKDDILNAIAEMSVMDVVDLVSAMEEKFGVTAAAAVAAAPAVGVDGDAGVGAAAEKDEFDIVLNAAGDKKVNVIKVNIINKKTRTKLTRGRKVKVVGYKKAIITLKKGQTIDLTTGV